MKKFVISRKQLNSLLSWLEFTGELSFSELVEIQEVDFSDRIIRVFHERGIIRDEITPLLEALESSDEDLWEITIAGPIDGVCTQWVIDTIVDLDEAVDMNPVEPSPTPKEPCVEVYVHGDWIVDINYRTNLGVQTKTYRLGEEYVEEEAVREAYTMFIAELGVEYSNSILASSDIVIMNAGQLPTPSYRTIKLN